MTTLNNGVSLSLQPIAEIELEYLYDGLYKDKNPEWKKWDAPYFKHELLSYKEFKEKWIERIKGPFPRSLAIKRNEELIGTVNFYWEHEPSHWLEAGILIFNPNYWNGGYGTEALALWVEELFHRFPHIPRVGITTWSGNKRMIRSAEKIGMQLEGRLRKCRFYDEEYYDSIRMGILREEWHAGKSLLPFFRE
jgi:RimJ/RimL family protein N-acetyltransferase